MITVTLPLPPSVNALYRNVRGKGRVKTERYNTWLNAAGWEIERARLGKIKGDYVLSMDCERPDRRKRDLGNLIKAVEDLLVTHRIIEDDSRAAAIHLYWAGTGRQCTVTVRAVGEQI